LNAIKINAELFPNIPRYLIVSEEFAKNLTVHDCVIVREEDLLETENSRVFKNTPKNWNWSQITYWTNTTRRFFVLEQFLKTFSREKLIHLESDTVLLDKRFIDNLFLESNWGIKYTKQDVTLGCASVFLVNSRNKLEKFNQFIIDNWNSPSETDMTLLAKYISSDDGINYLPSGDLVESKIVFDAGTIGRYFLGGDARNNRIPYSTRGLLPNTKEYFDPSPYKIELIDNSVKLIDSEENELLLACVHIHSKRVPQNILKLFKKLRKEGNAERNWYWKIGVLDSTVIKERIKSFIQRRILRNKSADPRFR
jgi:hypothetical protein